jgi:hypothetical protein
MMDARPVHRPIVAKLIHHRDYPGWSAVGTDHLERQADELEMTVRRQLVQVAQSTRSGTKSGRWV